MFIDDARIQSLHTNVVTAHLTCIALGSGAGTHLLRRHLVKEGPAAAGSHLTPRLLEATVTSSQTQILFRELGQTSLRFLAA